MPRLYMRMAMPRLYTRNTRRVCDVKGRGGHEDNAGNTRREKMSRISPKPGSLAVVLGSYKSVVCRRIRKEWPECGFAWQSGYYDHIIRDGVDHARIRRYVADNPRGWDKDEENQVVLGA